MEEFLEGWMSDLPQVWSQALGEVRLDFNAIAADLELEVWEPIFPVRRGQNFPGEPEGAHLLRAFDGPAPARVRCVILGQDPYPEPGLATGRAFEAGNIARWRELNKMFSRSIRAYLQMLLAARTGDPAYATSFDNWPKTLLAIEQGQVRLEAPDRLADHLEEQGVLLLNASLSITRFAPRPGRHQTRGHLVLWRPLIKTVIKTLIARNAALAIIGFGDAAAELLGAAGIAEGRTKNTICLLCPHPAEADALLARPNPFLLCNENLEAMGATPIEW